MKCQGHSKPRYRKPAKSMKRPGTVDYNKACGKKATVEAFIPLGEHLLTRHFCDECADLRAAQVASRGASIHTEPIN